jgi:hypothetical protein
MSRSPTNLHNTEPPPEIELPPEDVPFEDVVRKLLAAPPHEPRQKAQAKRKPGTTKKRARS